MAKASLTQPAVNPVWQAYVTITLSREEAQALYDVTGAIGGDLWKSKRRYFNGPEDSFREVLTPYVSASVTGKIHGTLYFYCEG